jgi:hypothetical protein
MGNPLELKEESQMRPVPILLILLLCMMVGLSCSAARAQDVGAASEAATIAVPVSEWQALKARLDSVERELQALKGVQEAAPPSEAPAGEQAAETAVPSAPASAGIFRSPTSV